MTGVNDPYETPLEPEVRVYKKIAIPEPISIPIPFQLVPAACAPSKM